MRKYGGCYLLPSAIYFNRYPKILLHSGMLKFGKQGVTQWYTVYTQWYTVVSLVIENTLALRPEPQCTSALPQCPTVLKLVIADYYHLQFMLTTIRKTLLHSGMLKFGKQGVTQWYTVYTQWYTVVGLVIENAMALRPEPQCTSALPQCPTVLKLVIADLRHPLIKKKLLTIERTTSLPGLQSRS